MGSIDLRAVHGRAHKVFEALNSKQLIIDIGKFCQVLNSMSLSYNWLVKEWITLIGLHYILLNDVIIHCTAR